MMPYREKEPASVVLLDQNNYSRTAIKHIVETLMGKDSVLSFSASKDLLEAMSAYDSTDTAIVAYNALDHVNFHVLSILGEYFTDLNILVIIYNPTIQAISLMRSVGIEKFLSGNDSIFALSTAMACQSEGLYLSPKLSEIIKDSGVYNLPEPEKLSSMERYVLRCLFSGLSPNYIAVRKGISIKTVSSHKLRALEKLSIRRFANFFMHT